MDFNSLRDFQKKDNIIGNEEEYSEVIQDNVDKGQTLTVLYDAQDKAVFNTDMLFDEENPMTKLVERGGTTVLIVTIGDTTKYLKLVVNTSEFTLSNNSEL
jgi:hypothetical protein